MRCEATRGCTGEVVGGYCELCGIAPSPVGASARQTPQPGARPATGGPGSATVTSFAARRSGTTRTRTSARNRLGAGLVEIPAVPVHEPSAAVMTEPSVPESKRFCAHDDEPVGRSRDGQPGRTSGFCRKCGTPFSFEPRLKPGDLVVGQYEVVGCLAHGGMGWVYLARDRNVSDMWVVLKGLLNAGDRDATAAAVAERRFLAEVDHPNIVKILNFVQHESSGYIVMEYVAGRSLKQILAARREANDGAPDPLPAAEAMAYIHEILSALGYLHDHGLLFCDFKLDNVIQTQHSLKLIDLGGVYRIDEPAAPIFGTVGYQAPEIAESGPSVTSDLFTVARTLAVMCIDFRGYQSTYRHTLPPRESEPLFQRYDSLYRLLLKGTAPDPDDRFQSADEMKEQLYGVLCEVVADAEKRPVPPTSTMFTGALRASVDRADWRVLPRPQVQISKEDPNAGYLAAITATNPQQMITQLREAPEQSVEVDLRVAAALIDSGDFAEAEAILARIEQGDPWEWRVSWSRGVAALAREAFSEARAHFETVYDALPGELAPKLAMAFACELAGDVGDAAQWYEIVSRTDPSTTSASFGLARCRLALGDRTAAITAFERVPDTSSGYIDAQSARIRCLSADNGGEPTLADLMSAGAILEALPIDREQLDRLSAKVLEAALELTIKGGPIENGSVLLGHALNERELRFGLEATYRSLARRASSRAERIRLVDDANRTRPRTWT